MMDNPRQQAARDAADHLVGNLFFNLGAVPVIAGRLPVDDMPDTPAKTVYGAMCEIMRDPNTKLSAGAVESALKRQRFDFGYMSELQARILPENPDTLIAYTVAIRDAAALRRADEIAGMLQAGARKGDQPAETLIAETLRKLTTVSDAPDGFHSAADITKELAEMAEAWKRGEMPGGRRTGFDGLDKLIRLQDSKMIVIAGRPSMGKSALAFQMAYNVAKELQQEGDPGCVVIFSAEMSRQDVLHRIACAVERVNGQELQFGTAQPQDYARYQRALVDVGRLPIETDDMSAPTTEQVYYRAAMMHAQRPIRLLVFDFIEKAGDEDKRGNDTARIGRIAGNLKNIAKSLRIPVAVVSQLSREVENRTNKLPRLSDLRQSGNIEAEADVVLMMYRPEYYLSRGESGVYLIDQSHKTGTAYALITKNRNGKIGTAVLSFVENFAAFGDLMPSPSANGRQREYSR